MIKFHCDRHHSSDNTPIVTDIALQEYAEAVMADYKPKLLKEPGKVNGLHFLESYLGANLDYQDIYYKEDEGQIAGATVFNDEKVLVFDREAQRIKPIDVPANTIILDNLTIQDGKEGFALFTELHEGGHFCIHPAVYRRFGNQMTLFDFGMEKNPGNHIVKCCRSTIEGKCERKSRLETQHDFREHQANIFAAAMAMPRPTFIPYAQELIRQCGNKDGIWVEPSEMDWDYVFGLEAIIEELASVFGVSKSAARVQMKRQGILFSENEYLQQRSQLAVAF